MKKTYTLLLFILLTSLVSSNLLAQYTVKSSSNLKNGISEKNVDLALKVYPNPVKSGEYITLKFENFNSNKPISIDIINIIGKKLLSTTIDSSSFKLLMTKNKYPAGIYIFKAKQNNKIRTLRLNIVK